MNPDIKCTFNLFQEGRTYTGHHRKYILENAMSLCYAPATREMIRLREALGYLGHGRRQLARKLGLEEVEAIKLPDGSAIVTENIPANVTTAFEIHNDGTVEHTQELLDTDPGRVVRGLNASRVGGFSWACGGVDGGALAATKLDSFHGFDYVMTPGFSANRGYILESAAETEMVLESIAKTSGVSEQVADKWLKHWTASAVLESAELRERLSNAAIHEDAIREELDAAREMITKLERSLSGAESREASRREMITEAARSSVVAIPPQVMDAMLSLSSEEDFYRLTAFFESAGRIDLSGLPVQHSGRVMRIPKDRQRRTPEYGTALAAYEI